MAISARDPGTLALLGGSLCLDFANTVSWHASDHPEEWLDSYEDLVAWAQHAGAIDAGDARRLRGEARRRRGDAALVLDQARELREAIYRTFAAVAARRSPAPADLVTLQRAFADAAAHARLEPVAGGFTWDWSGDVVLDRVLWPIARSAVELLTSEDVARVRECADGACGWLFRDQSRNRTRRWCSSADCGNRARVRRYHRRRAG